MRNNVIRFWNPAVFVVCVLAWFGLQYLIWTLEPNAAQPTSWQFVCVALIAVAAYVLMRGSPTVRRKWFTALPFVPCALLLFPLVLVPLLLDLLMGGRGVGLWKGWLAFMIMSIAWLGSYFAAIGLCAAINTGIRWWWVWRGSATRAKRWTAYTLVILLILGGGDQILKIQHMWIYATGTSEPAFLNATWMMSAEEIRRANGHSLTGPKSKSRDQRYTERSAIYRKPLPPPWDRHFRLTYEFFDEKLWRYTLRVENVYNHEKLIKAVVEHLSELYGTPRKIEHPDEDPFFFYDGEWRTDVMTIRYRVQEAKDQAHTIASVIATYQPMEAVVVRFLKTRAHEVVR